MPGTNVSYGKMTMYDVHTVDWSEEVVYDQHNADAMYSRCRATFRGLVTDRNVAGGAAHPVPYIDAGGSGSLSGSLNSIRGLAMIPRQELIIAVGSDEIVNVNGGGGAGGGSGASDVEHGPKPIAFAIESVYGESVMRVRFTIQWAWQTQCQGETPAVLNNRWMVDENIGPDKYLTRTIDGALRIASFVTDPQQYRELVVPRLETGFKRESLSYAVSADGLTCSYRIVDRQIETSSPWPAEVFEITHTEGTGDGVSWSSQARASLVGMPGAPLALLVRLAVEAIELKTKFNKDRKGLMVLSSSITTVQGDRNRVEADLAIRRTEEGNAQAIANSVDRITKPITQLRAVPGQPAQWVPTVSREPALYGYGLDGKPRAAAAAAVFNVFTQTPCSDHQIGSPGATGTGQEPASGQPTVVSESDASTVADQESLFTNAAIDDDQKSDPYMAVDISDHWQDDHLKVALPVADTSDETPGTKIIRLAKTQTKRTIRYAATRVGKPPDMPPLPEEYQEGESGADDASIVMGHLMRSSPATIAAKPTADGGSLLYSLSLEAVYCYTRPIKADMQRAIMKNPLISANTNTPKQLTLAELTRDSMQETA